MSILRQAQDNRRRAGLEEPGRATSKTCLMKLLQQRREAKEAAQEAHAVSLQAWMEELKGAFDDDVSDCDTEARTARRPRPLRARQQIKQPLASSQVDRRPRPLTARPKG